MEEKNPKKNNKEPEYYDVILTDIQLHSNEVRVTKEPWYMRALRSLRSKKPFRMYGDKMEITGDHEFKLFFPGDLPPNLKEAKQKAEAQGKVLRLLMPKEGVPVFLGKDVEEKMKAMEDKKRRSHGTRYSRNAENEQNRQNPPN